MVSSKKRGDIVGELVNVLFEPDCLLSGFQAQKKPVLEILSKTFENPLPMKTITKVVLDNDEYALNFFVRCRLYCCLRWGTQPGRNSVFR